MANGRAKEAHALLLDVFNNTAPTPEQIRLIGTRGERGRRHWRRLPIHERIPHRQRRSRRSPLNSSSWRWLRRTSPSCSDSASRHASTRSAKPWPKRAASAWSAVAAAKRSGLALLESRFRGPRPHHDSIRLRPAAPCRASRLAGCAARHRETGCTRSVRARQSRDLQIQRCRRSRRAQAGRQGLPESSAAIRRDGRLQFHGQHQLPRGDRQRPAAGQVQTGAARHRPAAAQHDAGYRRPVRSCEQSGPRQERRGFRTDARQMGSRRAAPT